MGNSRAFLIAVVLILACIISVKAQNQQCLGDLIPCQNYLNTTGRPSTACCNGIKKVIDTELTCLCSLYNNPGLVSVINVTQALALPSRCDINADINACNALAPGSMPPPATPGGNGNGNNAAGSRIPWVGMPVLVLASAFALLYH